MADFPTPPPDADPHRPEGPLPPHAPQGGHRQPADLFADRPVLRPDLKALRGLQELAPPYHLFSHALLTTHAGLDRDVVQEFVTGRVLPTVVFAYDCPRPLFAGLPEPWCRRVFGCEPAAWEELRRALATVAVVHRGDPRRSCRSFTVTTQAPDALALHTLAHLPPGWTEKVRIETVGVVGPAGLFFLADRPGRVEPARLTRLAATELDLAFLATAHAGTPVQTSPLPRVEGIPEPPPEHAL